MEDKVKVTFCKPTRRECICGGKVEAEHSTYKGAALVRLICRGCGAVTLYESASCEGEWWGTLMYRWDQVQDCLQRAKARAERPDGDAEYIEALERDKAALRKALDRSLHALRMWCPPEIEDFRREVARLLKQTETTVVEGEL